MNGSGDRQPRWRVLLTCADRHLKEIGLARSDWIWGGGTVLMLRHRHRLSWDIDLFLGNPQHLNFLSPRLNDSVAMMVDHYTEQANHLRCSIRGVGEIDYLLVAPVIDLEPESLEVEGLGRFNVMSDREILAQKLHYRAAVFTGRDLFDFITVTKAVPDLLGDPDLRGIAGRVSSALVHRMDDPALRKGFEAVIPIGEAPDFTEARLLFSTWLKETGPRPPKLDPPTISDPWKAPSPSD